MSDTLAHVGMAALFVLSLRRHSGLCIVLGIIVLRDGSKRLRSHAILKGVVFDRLPSITECNVVAGGCYWWNTALSFHF